MSPISRSFSLFTLSLLAFLLVDPSAARGTILGGWTLVKDTKDPYVVSVGEFAVAEHGKQAKANLEFVSVVSGQVQVVAGMNFQLVIEAKDAGSGRNSNYKAIVFDQEWKNLRSLSSFNPV